MGESQRRIPCWSPDRPLRWPILQGWSSVWPRGRRGLEVPIPPSRVVRSRSTVVPGSSRGGIPGHVPSTRRRGRINAALSCMTHTRHGSRFVPELLVPVSLPDSARTRGSFSQPASRIWQAWSPHTGDAPSRIRFTGGFLMIVRRAGAARRRLVAACGGGVSDLVDLYKTHPLLTPSGTSPSRLVHLPLGRCHSPPGTGCRRLPPTGKRSGRKRVGEVLGSSEKPRRGGSADSAADTCGASGRHRSRCRSY